MEDDSVPGLVRFLRSFSRVASVLTILVGCMVLVGWTLDVGVLQRVLPGLVAMNPITAVGFVLAGVSAWLLQEERVGRRARRIARACALVVAVMGSLKLLQMLIGWEVGIDQLLFANKLEAEAASTGFPNRMAPNTALNYFLLGGALFFLDSRTRGRRWPAQYLALPWWVSPCQPWSVISMASLICMAWPPTFPWLCTRLLPSSCSRSVSLALAPGAASWP